MKIKIHFLVTLGALFFLGVIIKTPDNYRPAQNDERNCKLIKGKMDCFYKYTENRINKNSEVQYKLD